MTTIAWRKSIVRPLASVTRPSSRICSRIAVTSGCAFSISSNSTTQYGRRRTGSVELARLRRGRRTRAARRAGARSVCDFGVFGQVDAHERVVGAEQRVRERARELGLADAARDRRTRKPPTGLRGSLSPARARRIASATVRSPPSCPTTRAPSASSSVEQAVRLRFGERALRDARPARDDRRRRRSRVDDASAVGAQRDRGRRFVDEVDRFVGQEAVGDVARRERGGRFDARRR